MSDNLTLGQYALLKHSGNPVEAAMDLLTQTILMIGFATRSGTKPERMAFLEATIDTLRESFERLVSKEDHYDA